MSKLTGRVLHLAAIVCVIALLPACVEEASQTQRAMETNSRTITPENAELASIYNRSCRSCHTIAATGAPLTGDTAIWAVRLEKGLGTLVDNVVNGFGGMPPFGMCMDCSAQEFEDLIVFMASEGEARDHD